MKHNVIARTRAWLRARPRHAISGLFFACLAVLVLTGCGEQEAANPVQLKDAQGEFNIDAFVDAAGLGDYDTVFRFLEQGADENAPNSEGQTALMRAVYRRQQDIVRLLLEHGADPDIRTPEGNSILVNAARVGDRGIVEMLLDKGVDINSQENDPKGVTPLNIAAYRENVQVAELLLDRGADFTIASSTGYTPLLSAVKSGNMAIARMLLAKGADVEARTREGQSALDIAKQNKHQEMVFLLERAGARE